MSQSRTYVAIPTDAESRDLARRARAGDIEARDELLVRNLPLIKHIAWRFRGRGRTEIDDLRQQGVFGLIRAVEKYDPGRRVRFATYAYRWVFQAMQRVALDDRAIRLPRWVQDGRADAEASTGWGRRSRAMARAAAAVSGRPARSLGHAADRIPAPDPGFGPEDREAVEWALGKIDARDAEVVRCWAAGDLNSLAEMRAKWRWSYPYMKFRHDRALAQLRRLVGA